METTPKGESKHKTEQILTKLKEAGITMNKDRCNINCDKEYYSGYQIPKERKSPDKKLRTETFLETNRFYSTYLSRYNDGIEPFLKLCQKNIGFIWTQGLIIAFEILKKAQSKELW